MLFVVVSVLPWFALFDVACNGYIATLMVQPFRRNMQPDVNALAQSHHKKPGQNLQLTFDPEPMQGGLYDQSHLARLDVAGKRRRI